MDAKKGTLARAAADLAGDEGETEWKISTSAVVDKVKLEGGKKGNRPGGKKRSASRKSDGD